MYLFINIIATYLRFCPSVTKPGPQCNYPIKIKFIARALISQLQYELQNRKGNDTLKLGSTTENDFFLNSTIKKLFHCTCFKKLSLKPLE